MMSMSNKLTYLLVTVAAVACIFGCKKDEEEATKNYLTGSVKIKVEGSDGTKYADMPMYVRAGQKFVFTPSGLSASDGTPIGYYFTRPITSVKDTILTPKFPATSFSYEIPDSLGTFALSFVGFAIGSSDYYTSSSYATFVVVDPALNKGSITGFPLYSDDVLQTVGDKQYYTTKVGSTTWMRQNLISGGIPFASCDAMLDVFGSYYTWQEAQTACPAGWRLPSEADWCALLKAAGAPATLSSYQDSPCGAGALMAHTYFNRTKMWEYFRDVNVTDKLHFSASPYGYATSNGNGTWAFNGYSSYAAFWTSDSKDGQGVYRYIYQDKDIVYAGLADKTGFALPVRCVK